MSIQPGVGYTFNASSQGSNLTIEKPWAPWATYATTEDPGHPFKIVNVQIVTSGESQVVRYQVQSGTLNNLVPVLDDYVSGTTVKLDRVTSGVPNPPTAQLDPAQYNGATKTSYIYLRAGPKATTPFNYPFDDVSSDRYPAVGGYNGESTPDTDIFSYLKIGSIAVDSISAPTTFTVTQFVMGSLWADRIKLGTTTAKYYYARI
jgi:hypothetical protein